MAETTDPNLDLDGAASDAAAAEAAGGVVDPAQRRWGELWQVPSIILSLTLIAFGIVVAANRAPAEDWDTALDEVRQLIVMGRLEDARERLVGSLEPYLHSAQPRHRARFHAIAADWIGYSQESRGASVADNNRRIAEQYGMAVEMGLALDGERIERWGRALVELGRLDDAEDRVVELEMLAEAGVSEAGERRNRLLRQLVERSLLEPDMTPEAMLARLENYRDDARLRDTDHAWAMDRQAALRIEQGDFRGAIDGLMLDMRRMDGRGVDLDEDLWAGFHVRIADAHWRMGGRDDAQFHIDAAEALFENNTALRGRGMLLQAKLDIEAQDRIAALPRLDRIVAEFVGTDLMLPARLLRAEVQAAMGDHAAAIEDYGLVRDELSLGAPRRDVTPRDAILSLGDRRDAMIASGDLETALAYARVAQSIHDVDPEAAPTDVLERVAMINEQIADRLLAGAREALAADARSDGRPIDAARVPEAAIPAQIRAEAQARLHDAADHYLRHARRVLRIPGQERRYLASLWAAADSFERAGRPDEAIDAMETYLGGGDSDDPRRPEVLFRLAQILESLERPEEAVARYRQVIDEDPRTIGTRAHAPMARALLTLGRINEAEEALLAVVEGRQAGDAVLTPDAGDYRTALIDLGRLHYEHATTMPGADGGPVDDGVARERIRQAIERFDAALVREPDAEDADEVRFWLADSHRRLADLLSEQGRTPGTRRDFVAARAAHLETAHDGFEGIIAAWTEIDPRLLDRRRRSMLRNAYLNRARASFDLERWEQAAWQYDQTARRYADDHASMQALVQIVNCYERLGAREKADVAHRNALLRLEQLPDSAFEADDSLMDRDAWTQWLRHRPVGRMASAAADGGGATP